MGGNLPMTVRHSARRTRVLFLAENITLAQVVRLVSLARQLDASRYEVHFACADFEPLIFRGTHFRQWPIHTVPRVDALRRVQRGERVYEEAILRRYVEDDLRLFDAVSPDIVIGDFRLSLSISAPFARVPLAVLINAYWSPNFVRKEFPLPDHPIVQWVGVERAKKYLPQALPFAFKHFAAPVNQLRKRYGMQSIGSLLEVLTYGNYTLYPDIPELCPTQDLPASHRYLGWIPWSPVSELPEVVREAGKLPLIYVTLGSSGDLAVLNAILRALSEMPVRAILSTAGRYVPTELPENVTAVDYVPGHLVAQRSAAVITNGGSSTGYQALAQGTPVLGIPSNMDQYLAMSVIEGQGAGRVVRGGAADARAIQSVLHEMLQNDTYRLAASRLQRASSAYDCHSAFSEFIGEVTKPGVASDIQTCG